MVTRSATVMASSDLTGAAWVALVIAISSALAIAQPQANSAPSPAATVAPASAPATQAAEPAEPPIRVALFDLDVSDNLDCDGARVNAAALSDQVNVILGGMTAVTIVNREQIAKVAAEHQMALSGLVDTASAVRLGGFLSADYVVVGRASRIGQTNHLVLKVISVATTAQTTVAAKAPAEDGVEVLLERLRATLAPKVEELRRPVDPSDASAIARVARSAGFLRGKAVLVDVNETHVNRPLRDPAAQTAICNRLRAIGVEVIVPVQPVSGWKETLLESGVYAGRRMDYLVEGEGTSAFAAQIQGMTSCRARVELRLIAVPGRVVTATDKGVAAQVDLVEDLAAKAALEAAGANALDTLIISYDQRLQSASSRPVMSRP